ncbi:MAG: tRNA pseudouridine(38-40) synthase TruA [Planctomycetota bacterium]
MTTSFLSTIAYDGTDYVGWQVQPNGNSIQAELQTALAKVVGHAVSIVGSGRTDAGVHAMAQAASFELPAWNHGPDSLRRAWNVHLPGDIVITDVQARPSGFHAIRDCVEKRYRYQMQIAGPADPSTCRYRHFPRGTALQVAPMQQAAQRLLGTHDFACFQATGAPRSSTVRTIVESRLHVSTDPTGTRSWLDYEVAANGFLYNMVRNIVGTLIEIGRGKQAPDWIDALIASGDRNQAGATAPPHGLFLWQAIYPPVA